MYIHCFVSHEVRSENPIRILRVGNFSDEFDDVFSLLTSGLSKNKANRKFFMGHTKVLEKFHILFYQMKKKWQSPKFILFLQILCALLSLMFPRLFSPSSSINTQEIMISASLSDIFNITKHKRFSRQIRKPFALIRAMQVSKVGTGPNV